MALKIGRQKKIQIIDGQQVEVLTGDDEDEEDMDEEDEDDIMAESSPTAGGASSGTSNIEQKMMAVEGNDGQQYVVLEVIQLPENSDSVKMETKPKIVRESPKKIKADSEKKQADLATAFGFDDDEDD